MKFQDQVPSLATPDVSALSHTLSLLADHMMASMDLQRRDRLWPADPIVFQTNALNLAYGACGTALFLYDFLGEVPDSVRAWLLSQPIDVSSYPPGLYSGIAGIAWSFAEMGMVERGIELLRLVPESPLVFGATDIFNGAAGWGLASLVFYLRTGGEEFLAQACCAGNFLLKLAEHDDKGAFWRSEDNSIRLGFALGGSGVAVFLLYLWRATTDAKYLCLAREAMEFEIAHARVLDDTFVWGITTSGVDYRPYWLRGGGGVVAALIRFAQILKEDRYWKIAERGARGCAVFFSVAPHLFEGLASMGETLLDMFLATGKTFYLDAAQQKAAQILLYRIRRPEGLAFPGRFLLRISHDYGMGGAGIGLYLSRLMGLKSRKFHDIDSMTGGQASEAWKT